MRKTIRVIIILVGLSILVYFTDLNKIKIGQKPCVFQSEIVGIEFSYPCKWGKFSERVNPANQYDTLPYEHWGFVKEKRDDTHFRLHTNNKDTATFTYEGGGNIIRYYGQPLKDICKNLDFLNPKNYKVESIQCQNLINPNGLEYVYFDIKVSTLFEYGFIKENKLVKLVLDRIFPKVYAQSFGTIFKVKGILFPSKSEKWQGVAMYAYLYEYRNNDEDQVNFLSAWKEIEEILPTIRYIK